MKNIKYLYGKKEYLSQIITGNGFIKFDHIKTFVKRENEAIKDDEINKQLVLNGDNTKTVKITIGDKSKEFNFEPKSLATMQFIPRDMYVKCFSNKAYSLDLYERFNSDICLEIDIDKLTKALNAVLNKNYSDKKIKIDFRNIIYYDKFSDFDIFNGKMDFVDFAFIKPKKYQIEDEFRFIIYFEQSNLNEGKEMIMTVPELGSSYYFVKGYKEKL